ncbi:MAG: carboxypeptidase regulatory-like domain-containing protein [Myxococcota bacterium]|nr:carboxypeptidase regulatory-like domain-containing protein [Myxococcota bacterium]
MKRLLVLTALAAVPPLTMLVACEGEAPINAPENTLATGSAVAPASGPPSEPEAPALAASTNACPPPPCAPASSGPIAAGNATAAPEASSSAVSLTPPSIVRGNIVGSVTAKPVAAMGQAVVYLEDGPDEDAPSHLQSVTIDNRQMNFVPFVSIVAVGGKAVFANQDPFPHNVFSPDNEKFNMGNIPQNGAHVRVFKNPGAYSLLCNLHPGMLGYLLVTPSTWFTRTDAKGNFNMKHVPAGTYKVTAWAPRQAPVTEPVTVTDGEATVHFDLHR